MIKTVLVAGAFACLSFGAHAQECATIADLANAAAGAGGQAAILEVVEANSKNLDYLVVFKDIAGNLSVIGETNGCLVGGPMLLDYASEEKPA